MILIRALRRCSRSAGVSVAVDVVSSGRLDFGIGAGGSRLRGAPESLAGVVRREFEAYGVPVVPAGEAVAALDEACTLIRRMWTEDGAFDFGGRYYQLRGAVREPRPLQQPHPPCCWSSSRQGPRTRSSRPCRRGPNGQPGGSPMRPPGRSRRSSPRAEPASGTVTRSDSRQHHTLAWR